MVENLFIFLFYNISSQQGEQKQTRERDGDSLAWYCFQHPHTGKQGNRGHLLCYLPCEISLTPLREAWLLFSLGFSSPRTGSLAWLLEQGIKPQGRLKSQNHLGL